MFAFEEEREKGKDIGLRKWRDVSGLVFFVFVFLVYFIILVEE